MKRVKGGITRWVREHNECKPVGVDPFARRIYYPKGVPQCAQYESDILVNPSQLGHFLPTWLPHCEQKKDSGSKGLPHSGHSPFLRRTLVTRSCVKSRFCRIYMADTKIPAPINPAKTSGKQSKTKMAMVLINRSVPYQRKALLTVWPNLPNLGP